MTGYDAGQDLLQLLFMMFVRRMELNEIEEMNEIEWMDGARGS